MRTSLLNILPLQFTPTTLTLDSGVTRPPPLLSEADLLSCMDKAGIGTDATMHDHIKKLLDRFYATKDANTHFSPTKLGEALVMGYDEMGYELWKPNLRSLMEGDMKAVSIGTKRKAQVLNDCLQQMKACFLDAKLKKRKLFEAMEVFFERSGSSESHAVGEIVRRCGLCQEADMVLRRKPDGNFMVGCLGFPQCRNAVWLPGSISEATVTTILCNSCSPGPIFKIQFKFRRLEIPPNYSVDHLGCVAGCDETLRELIDICGTGSRSTSNIPARGRGSTASSSHVQQTYTRHSSCAHCRQPGHSSGNCPSQRSAQSHGMNTQNGDSSIPCNFCGRPCIQRTANTANNRGRHFYKCQSQECDFFVWVDGIGNSAGGRASHAGANRSVSNSSRRSGHGRGGGRSSAHGNDMTFVSATGDPVSDRRCFVCGDPSHFANACPNRGR